MKNWPPALRSELFGRAAWQMIAWAESGEVETGFRHCALRAITAKTTNPNDLGECYVAKGFFTALFRQKTTKFNQPWWPKGDIHARVIALLLAEQIAKDMTLG